MEVIPFPSIEHFNNDPSQLYVCVHIYTYVYNIHTYTIYIYFFTYKIQDKNHANYKENKRKSNKSYQIPQKFKGGYKLELKIHPNDWKP